jgi:hypothetical protein
MLVACCEVFSVGDNKVLKSAMHVGDRRLQMHMLHWKRNSLRALWMGQKLERASLFCRRFCPAWLESEEVHPGERESYSAFPLQWQHTTRA